MLKTFSSVLVLCACIAGTAAAQPVSAGLKFGVPLTDAFTVKPSDALQYAASTSRYTVGPFVELRLPLQFSIEVDALYKSYAYSLIQPLPVIPASAGSWEFPVLAKYRLAGGPVRPYVEGGVAFSHLTNVTHGAPELSNSSNFGVVAGAGLELHLALLKISPEIRYNGWTLRNFESPGSLLQSNRNQATVLVGISF